MNKTKCFFCVAMLFSISQTALANNLQQATLGAISDQGSPVEALEYHADDAHTKQLVAQAKQRIKVFSSKLKTALLGAVQEQGFSHAVTVCKDKAPLIAQELSTDGWTIARTSLRVRNIENAANDWEQVMLRKFDQRYKGGELAESLHSSKLDDEGFKYMQAIPTGELCLACHGKSVDPSLLQRIQTHYPEDKATGFTLKDIRGAFVVTNAKSFSNT
jgi:hypothetical protein